MSSEIDSSKEERYRKAIQKSLAEIKVLREKVKYLDEPIAIVGMACRFPGGIDSIKDYWECLSEGKDAITDLEDTDRWDMKRLYSPDKNDKGKICSKSMGLVYKIDHFDGEFFGLSDAESVGTDPQQHLLLTVTQECIENSGYAPSALAGKDIAVFIGICTQDFSQTKIRHLEYPSDVLPIDGVGSAFSAAAGRISYTYDFKGPCCAIETACSSSLMALHQAVNSIRRRESEMAFIGGVNVLLQADVSSVFSMAGMLSPDGRCKTFDNSADGYVRAEGCGMIMLKPLSSAIRDQDRIYASIKGCATNQDGRSLALTSPSEQAQQRVIEKALQNASVSPGQISYIEAHGTGTWLGDPIEITALNTVFGKGRTKEQPLYVGTAKCNIGHLEGAAGVAGIIKTALSLYNQKITKLLHFSTPNAVIPWQEYMVVPRATIDWDFHQGARMAGVSAFGFSGINVHVILQEYIAPSKTDKSDGADTSAIVDDSDYILKISAKTEPALLLQVSQYHEFLNALDENLLNDFCNTANVGRDSYRFRVVLRGGSKDALLTSIAKIMSLKIDDGSVLDSSLLNKISSLDDDNVFVGDAENTEPKVAFVYSDSADQFSTVGLKLYEQSSVFKGAFDECVAIFSTLSSSLAADTFVGSLLRDSECLLTDEHQRYFNFSIQYSLTKLWISLGVKPKTVIAYGAGEYMAGCLAGVLSLQDACKLVHGDGEGVNFMRPIISYCSPRITNKTKAQLKESDYWSTVLDSNVVESGATGSGFEWLEKSIFDDSQLVVEFSAQQDLLVCITEMFAGAEAATFFVQAINASKDAVTSGQEVLAKSFCAGVSVKWRPPLIKVGRKITIPTYPFQPKRHWHRLMPFEINK